MVGAQIELSPTDRRIEAAIKAINRRTGCAAKLTAIRAALNFTIAATTVRRAIYRLEDAGLVYRYSERTGYYAGTPPANASTRHNPLVSPKWANHARYKARHTSDAMLRQTELRLLVEVGRATVTPPKPTRPPKRNATQSNDPKQLLLPLGIADAA